DHRRGRGPHRGARHARRAHRTPRPLRRAVPAPALDRAAGGDVSGADEETERRRADAEAVTRLVGDGAGVAAGEGQPGERSSWRGRGGHAEEQIRGTQDIAMLLGLWRYVRPYQGLFWLSMLLLPAI